MYIAEGMDSISMVKNVVAKKAYLYISYAFVRTDFCNMHVTGGYLPVLWPPNCYGGQYVVE